MDILEKINYFVEKVEKITIKKMSEPLYSNNYTYKYDIFFDKKNIGSVEIGNIKGKIGIGRFYIKKDFIELFIYNINKSSFPNFQPTQAYIKKFLKKKIS